MKANSPRQELEWAMADLRRCRENTVEAIGVEELAAERVEAARKEVNKQKVCTDCGQTPKLAMDAHLVICVRTSSVKK